MVTLSDRLKELRKSNNLTQSDLGKILGVGKTTISMYENGNSTPNDEIKLKIAKYFNVTVDYLLGTSNTQSIDQSKNNLSEQLAMKLISELEKDGYKITEDDLPNLILASKITLAQSKKNQDD